MARRVGPDIEARLAELAVRLGLAGPNAPERVLQMALEALEDKTLPQPAKMTAAETKAELQALEKLSATGRHWREENPGEYDENNPPSAGWQEELYDGSGLPK